MTVKLEALDHLVINVADVAVTAAERDGRIPRHGSQGVGPRRRQSAADLRCNSRNEKTYVWVRDADNEAGLTADHQTAGSEYLTPGRGGWHIPGHMASRSKRARLPSKVPAAPCARSIAGIRMVA